MYKFFQMLQTVSKVSFTNYFKKCCFFLMTTIYLKAGSFLKKLQANFLKWGCPLKHFLKVVYKQFISKVIVSLKFCRDSLKSVVFYWILQTNFLKSSQPLKYFFHSKSNCTFKTSQKFSQKCCFLVNFTDKFS